MDIATDVALLMNLINSVNQRFGLTEAQLEAMDAQTKAIIYAIIKKNGINLVGKTLTKEIIMAVLKKVGSRVTAKQVTKFIPVIGQ